MNVAVWPALTVTFCGCPVMDGATPFDPLPPLPVEQAHSKTARQRSAAIVSVDFARDFIRCVSKDFNAGMNIERHSIPAGRERRASREPQLGKTEGSILHSLGCSVHLFEGAVRGQLPEAELRLRIKSCDLAVKISRW